MKFLSEWFSKLTGGSKPAQKFDKIIAAKVLSINKHPNADRLQVVELTDGTSTLGPIVCGAFNLAVGDIVALALPGAAISQNIHSEKAEPFVVQKATIRGVESQGMICAAFELGLSSEKGQGVMILKDNVLPGTKFSKDLIKV